MQNCSHPNCGKIEKYQHSPLEGDSVFCLALKAINIQCIPFPDGESEFAVDKKTSIIPPSSIFA